jgi:hypothetical protein
MYYIIKKHPCQGVLDGLGGGLNGQSGHPAPQHPLERFSEVLTDNFDTFFFMSDDI